MIKEMCILCDKEFSVPELEEAMFILTRKSIYFCVPCIEKKIKNLEKSEGVITKHFEIQSQNQEDLITVYLKETGLKPSEIELVEERSIDSLKTIWYCRPRGV